MSPEGRNSIYQDVPNLVSYKLHTKRGHMLPVTIDYYVDFDTDSFSNIVPVIQEEDTDEEELLLGKKMLRDELCKEIAMFTGKLESPG